MIDISPFGKAVEIMRQVIICQLADEPAGDGNFQQIKQY